MAKTNRMRKAWLTRDPDHGPEGTFGTFRTDSGFQVYSLERPVDGDHPCIPAGTYQVVLKPFPKHGKCYEVCDVPGRTAILIHPANWTEQLLGCIALGRAIDTVSGVWEGNKINHRGLMSSKDAVMGLMSDMEKESFLLTISWA